MVAASSRYRSQARTSLQWSRYFQANLQRLLDIPWHQGAGWSEEERTSFSASLQDFQLGESSAGRNLIARAQDYAARSGDGSYEQAIRLFIQEEQRHSRLLAEFLMVAGVPLVAHSWLDGLFRRLRRLAGLELSITVLVIAETIGKVYYHALRRATGSALLRRLCVQLLRDEVMHLRFHAERLALLRRKRAPWKCKLAELGHGLLFRGTSLAVWCKHWRAFRGAGMGFVNYWRRCQEDNRFLLKRSRPEHYDFDRPINLPAYRLAAADARQFPVRTD